MLAVHFVSSLLEEPGRFTRGRLAKGCFLMGRYPGSTLSSWEALAVLTPDKQAWHSRVDCVLLPPAPGP